MTIDNRSQYEYKYDPDDPTSYSNGTFYVHRKVASLMLGRPLTKDEVVHHIDGNRNNNDPSNLMVLTSSEHSKLHSEERKTKFPHPCVICGEETKNKKYCSHKCANLSRRRVDRPSLETLLKLSETMSRVAIGKMFGVTDNTIKKWIKKYQKEL